MSTANYSCHPGYNLTGAAIRMCNSSGSWTPEEPVCNGRPLFVPNESKVMYVCLYTSYSSVVNCGTLSNPTNGSVNTSSGTTYQQVAVYTCHTGYNVTGSNTSTCGADGMWTPAAPTCEREWSILIMSLYYSLYSCMGI